MKTKCILTAISFLVSVPAVAQVPTPYADITFSEADIREFVGLIDDLSMPQKARNQLMGIIQEFERRAVAKQEAAKAAKKSDPEK